MHKGYSNANIEALGAFARENFTMSPYGKALSSQKARFRFISWMVERVNFVRVDKLSYSQ